MTFSPAPRAESCESAGPHDEVTRFLRGMWRFNRALGQQLEPLLHEKHGIEPRTYFLLKSIQGGNLYPKTLAEHLKIPASLISRYLDLLVRKGLVERHLDEQDSRRIRLSLTDEGQRIARESEQTVYDLASARLSKLEPGALRTLLGALETLADEGAPQ